MRHNCRTRRLGRNMTKRKALLEALVTSLLKHQQITTTLPKAKEAKRLADRIITLGKADTLHARRRVFAHLQDHKLTSQLFKEVAPRFKKRNGGYTRVLHIAKARKGDGAALAVLELTEKEVKVVEAPKGKAKKALPNATAAKPAKTADSKKTEVAEKPQAPSEKDAYKAQKTDKKGGPAGKGFFRNIGKFFRNKGGG